MKARRSTSWRTFSRRPCPWSSRAKTLSGHVSSRCLRGYLWYASSILTGVRDTDPAFPHSPLLVAASNCDSVVLRWKSFEDDRWPVDAYVLQRFPDQQAQPQWTVLSSSNASELIDTAVIPGFHYTYRVQAVSGDVLSGYSYHWTRIKSISEDRMIEVAARAGWLGPMHSMAHRHSDALRTIGLIFACFLTVYGLMRANVKGVQGTRSRSYRLKRIKKSTSEGVAAAAAVAASTSKALPYRRSSSSSTSSPGSVPMDSARSNSLDEMAAAADAGRRASVTTTTRESTAEDPTTVEEPPFRRQARSLSTTRPGEKAEYCQDCRKRFGIFRRRHLCDICHSVTLCRKCGFQAPVESFSSGAVGQRASSVSTASSKQRKLKIRTICRACCDDVYRYSTAPGVRPTLVPHHHSV